MKENNDYWILHPLSYISEELSSYPLFIIGVIAALCFTSSALSTMKPVNPDDKYQVNANVSYVGKNEDVFRVYSGIKMDKAVENQEYVLVDDGYSFLNADNYNKIASYGDQIVFASGELPKDITYEVSSVLNPSVSTWSDMGFKYADFDGTVNVRSPYSGNAVAGFVAENSPSQDYIGKVSYSYNRPSPKAINIMLSTDFDIMDGYYKLNTDETAPSYLKFDLYARKDIGDNAIPEIPGMELLTEDKEYKVIFARDDVMSKWVDFGFLMFPVFMIGVLLYLNLYDDIEEDKKYIANKEANYR